MSEARRILIVAYHFPPLAGSSGIQRTLRFVQQLPRFGWRPVVLTAHPRAYERTRADLMSEVPREVPVIRAAAWDASRHFSFRGRYIAAFSRPDRWMSWRFDAIRQGLRTIEQFKPQAIFSTYPIATAHLIAAELQCRSGLPWLADFRDPMAQDGYPADRKTWKQYKQIEEHALLHAQACLFTTPSAAAEYRQRYPAAAHKVRVLENGYDEETFAASAALHDGGPLVPGAKTLLHSGIVYPSERDPTQLMVALGRMHAQGRISAKTVRVRFRAAVAEELLQRLAEEHGVSAYVEVLPAIPYKDALSEMLRADGLLLLQASNCNAQIPAKIYEYLRAGRPIVCLADAAGDTVDALRRAGVMAHANLADPDAICTLLGRFLLTDASNEFLPDPLIVPNSSRLHRTEKLANILEGFCKPTRALSE